MSNVVESPLWPWQTFAGLSHFGPAIASGHFDPGAHLFITGPDKAVYHKWRDRYDLEWKPSPQDVNDWQRFNIKAKSAPAVAVYNSNVQLFVIGEKDDAIYHKWYDANGWNPSQADVDYWQRFEIKAKYAPAVAFTGERREFVQLFVVGDDDSVYHKWHDGNGWHPSESDVNHWQRFNIKAKSAPAVASTAFEMQLFVVGEDDAIYHKWYDANGWNPSQADVDYWQRFEIKAKYAPAVIIRSDGSIHLFVVGEDHVLNHKWHDSKGWHPSEPEVNDWQRFESDIHQAPSVTENPSYHFEEHKRLYVFAVGPNDDLHFMWYDINGWHS